MAAADAKRRLARIIFLASPASCEQNRADIHSMTPPMSNFPLLSKHGALVAETKARSKSSTQRSYSRSYVVIHILQLQSFHVQLPSRCTVTYNVFADVCSFSNRLCGELSPFKTFMLIRGSIKVLQTHAIS